MSKRSTQTAGPITRRQQVAAFKAMKGQEIAEAVGEKIRSATAEEVERQLAPIVKTILESLDRIKALEIQDERDRDSRSEREEALSIQQDDEVVSEPCHDGASDCGADGA